MKSDGQTISSCRRDMDDGVKKDMWSVMEDFSKAPGGQDLNKMKTQYEMFVERSGQKKPSKCF